MLQQTQTYRVEPKFEQFIATFSTFEMLAQATLAEVLSVWQGLGYNRRAKFLHQAAHIIVQKYDGILPDDPEILVELPGIGPATAASMTAFAYNKPTVFIETNIRAVFIHTFFPPDESSIADKVLLNLIEQTVDLANPREWYYALMDYGVYLKKLHKNPSRRSKKHVKQGVFEGSARQIRGKIIKFLIDIKRATREEIISFVADEQQRTALLIENLINEQILQVQNGLITIK